MDNIHTDKVSTKKILTIAIPLILQQLSLQMQVWVDRAMLGHVDSKYFSAVGNALIPFYAVVAVINAICRGSTILIAQNIGAKNISQSKDYAECSFIGNSIFPLMAFLFFFFASDFLFKLLGVQSPILEYSASYIKILSFTLLILGIVPTSASIMQGIGITKMIMIAGIISNILNIILDWILIYGKFGFPQMNIEGAALASTISNYATAPIMITYVFLSKNIPFKINIKKVLNFRWSLYKNVLKIGIPSGLEYMLWNVGTLIVISFLNRLDIMAAGIFTLIFSIESLPLFLYMGFANAALTLVGHKTGEEKHDQAVNAGFRCLRFSMIICAFIAVLYLFFPKVILGLFTNDKLLIGFSAPFLMFECITMFPKSINNVIGLGIRGTGDTRWMLYVQIFGTVLVITLSYVLIFIANLRLWGIFITLLVDETVRGVINLLRFWKGREFFFLKPFKKVISTQ